MIPDFNGSGNLPKGIHYATLNEIVAQFGYNPKRAWLIGGESLFLRKLVRGLPALTSSKKLRDHYCLRLPRFVLRTCRYVTSSYTRC